MERGLGQSGRPRHGDVLDRDAVRGDVVDLARRGDVHQLVVLDLDLVARRQEGVEAHDEVRVALEELRHSADDPRGVDAVGRDQRGTLSIYTESRAPVFQGLRQEVQSLVLMDKILDLSRDNKFEEA